MSLARLQYAKSIHKYQSYFYILAMSSQKLDFKKRTKTKNSYLGTNTTKDVKDLYTEQYKTPLEFQKLRVFFTDQKVQYY